jgi:hypothetical protein
LINNQEHIIDEAINAGMLRTYDARSIAEPITKLINLLGFMVVEIDRYDIQFR